MRRLPPLHALRAFEAAARHLHFAHAADELGLTPTAISHQVRQLEQILGVELFHRYPRPVRLTAEGEKLYPVLRESLDRIAGTIAGLGAGKGDEPLRLSVTVAFASRWLMPRLPQLRRQTGLSVAVEADDVAVDLHASGIDIAIRYAEQPGAEAEWHRLFPDRVIAVAAPGLVAGRAALSGREIMDLPLLHYRWKTRSGKAPDWQRWQGLAGLAAEVPEIAQNFSEEIHAIDAAVAGHGVVLASEVLVADLLRSRQLVALSDIALPAPSYWAVFLPGNPLRTRLQLLVDWIRRQS
ncbi:LysR substrate-binding domain-containing protein [Paracoccus siganidrum]|uniref:LysR family transcriptional regulator n=1 Tax=Paracoccus siganidrum TaxID=1276757 RepID=A0A419A9D5_9RHOB|nr:LysR substrate-binding domain-containing protein [Paracoccus siganidrum]RJL19289.1 LysR family transcriptional regulator [Paracoccus siganidrum]RMC33053.1 LysR family transcriptional regulator [Paracoccus siganidrum]